MIGFPRRKGSLDIEAELRASRPAPRPEFVETLAASVRTERTRPRFASARVAFAVGLSTSALVAIAAVGGLSYAASSAAKAGSTAQSSSQKQYKFVVCHRPPGNPSNMHTLEVGSQQAQNAHLKHGDTTGPCPNGR